MIKKFKKIHFYDLPDDFEDPRVLDENDIIKKLDSVSFSKDFDVVLEGLTDRERTMLITLFGLDGGKPQPIEDIAQKACLSKAAVQHDILRASRKIRYHLTLLTDLCRSDSLDISVISANIPESPEYIPPASDIIEKVYSDVPSAHIQCVHSLQPDSFQLNEFAAFTTTQKKWLYALGFFATDKKALAKHLADHVFKCEVNMVSTHFAYTFGKPLLQAYRLQNQIWQDIVDAGLEEKALEYLSPIQEQDKKEKRWRREMDEKLAVAYSFIPDNEDARFARGYECYSCYPYALDERFKERWIYSLLYFGPKDEEGRQELMHYIANEILNCPVSDVAAIATCLSEEGRNEYRKKDSWFVDRGLKSIHEYIEEKRVK